MLEPVSCEECGDAVVLERTLDGVLECPQCGLCVEWSEERTTPRSREILNSDDTREILISDDTKYGTRDMFQKEMRNTGEYWPFELGQGVSPYKRALLRQKEEKKMTSIEIGKNQFQKIPTLMDNPRVFTTEPDIQYALMNYYDAKNSNVAGQPLQQISVTEAHYVVLALARTSVHGLFIPPWVRTSADAGVPSKLQHWKALVGLDAGPSEFPPSWKKLIDAAHQRVAATLIDEQAMSLMLALMDSGVASRALLSKEAQKDLRSTLSQRTSQAVEALDIEAKETGFESGVDLIEQTFQRNQTTAPSWFPCFHLNAALVAHVVLSLTLDLDSMTLRDKEALRTLMDAILPPRGATGDIWDGGAQEGLFCTTSGRSCLSTWQEIERFIKLNVKHA